MTTDPDIRWKQRYSNFRRAFSLLCEAVEEGPDALSLLEKEGVIQRFEYSFELAWKTIKDFLEQEGLVITPVTARQVLKEAAAVKIIQRIEIWIEMVDHRNLLSHTYDSGVFGEAVEAIATRYVPAMKEVNDFFLARVDG